ncbi:MAG: hypothetical protein VXZ72_04250 [Chlamydiota bacterium]|nr:hypothetical protein [Chlamydiota bacterium]
MLFSLSIPGGGHLHRSLRLSDVPHATPFADIHNILIGKRQEADAFYHQLHPHNLTEDEKAVQRQALAGMIWSQQIYLYDVNRWIKGDDPDEELPVEGIRAVNQHWKHLVSKRILSMPDKWEYPWFAAWDLAFHTLSLSLVDMPSAKNQLLALVEEAFQHPNGQIPAYEWNFSDINPPVQAWAVWRLFKMEKAKSGKEDLPFLKESFHKLLLNFSWWVNKVDSQGNNVFEGGFLGLDNITLIDRSEPLEGGGRIEQSDGTGWMGCFCLTLMRMALELAQTDSTYESLAIKFFEHFIYIATGLVEAEGRSVQNWDEGDGFFYDVVSSPESGHQHIKVRSLVGLIPLFAVDAITEEELQRFPHFAESFHWFTKNREDICRHGITPIEGGSLLSLASREKMVRILERVWDPEEFRSPYGLRSLSKVYGEHPYSLLGQTIQYEPGEAISTLKGGNSNWRGPIWIPTNFLFIDALERFSFYYGDDLLIRVGRESPVSLGEMASYFREGVISLFTRNKEDKRPVHGDCQLQQENEHFRDHILYYEHYHGETGRGLGASHQTGWSGLVANLIDERNQPLIY